MATTQQAIEALVESSVEVSCTGVERWRTADKEVQAANTLDMARAAVLLQGLKERQENRAAGRKTTWLMDYYSNGG